MQLSPRSFLEIRPRRFLDPIYYTIYMAFLSLTFLLLRMLRRLLPRDAILVGHSFSVDLRALKMFHPYIIDTALMPAYKDARGKSRKLKDLARDFLGKSMQVGFDLYLDICI